MKKTPIIELNTAETIGAIVILVWIVASIFVPLPPINSLGA